MTMPLGRDFSSTFRGRPVSDAIVPQLLRLPVALRNAGMQVPVDRSARFVEAVSLLDLGTRDDVYWAGRATLCSDPSDLIVFDQCFVACFGGAHEFSIESVQPRTALVATMNPDEVGFGPDGPGSVAAPSDVELLRSRDVAELSVEERECLWREFAALRVRPPMRRSRRFQQSARGVVDIRATLRAQLRRAGEPAPLRHRKRRARPARVVMLVDVSGSMEPYTEALLRWAHRVVAQVHRTEVFTVGTRLSHVTDALRFRDPDAALSRVAAVVPDWSGGTRLAECLEAFRRRWGRVGMGRGAVIVIASDGFERGDPALLRREAEELARLARTIVWVSPHRGKEGYRPVQSGIVAVLPHIDALVAGHSLEAFQEVLDLLGGTGYLSRVR